MFDSYDIKTAAYLSFSDCPQCLNNRQLDIHVRRLIQELHYRLHHPRCGLLELGMFLGEKEHLVIEEVPVAGIFADCDNSNQETRCCGKIGGLGVTQ